MLSNLRNSPANWLLSVYLTTSDKTSLVGNYHFKFSGLSNFHMQHFKNKEFQIMACLLKSGWVYISTSYQTKFFICNREFGPKIWYQTRLVLAVFTYKLHKSVEFGLIFSGSISYYFKYIHSMLDNCSIVMINQSINQYFDQSINFSQSPINRLINQSVNQSIYIQLIVK